MKGSEKNALKYDQQKEICYVIQGKHEAHMATYAWKLMWLGVSTYGHARAFSYIEINMPHVVIIG